MTKDGDQLDLQSIRERLSKAQGQKYWRSLEELAETEEFQRFLHDEFPNRSDVWSDPVGRRRFLKLMGASLAIAGLGACTRQPDEMILPYVNAPEDVIPGKPLFFATAFTLGGYATGVLVESHMGRPTKIEGNPDHPASLGATDIFAQASILTLYDPDRSQVVNHRGRISTWSTFLAALDDQLNAQEIRQGAGLRILTETVTSPTLAFEIGRLLARYPRAKWHQYDPSSRDNAKEGARSAFGEYVDTRYRLDKADVVVSLDSDFVTSLPGSLRYAREFIGRRQADQQAGMTRLYAIESVPTNTGALADHRLPLSPTQIEIFARALASRLGLQVAAPETAWAVWIEALARDLREHRGRCLLIAGDQQPPEVHALAHLMNHALGNVNQTVFYTDPVEARAENHLGSLRGLVREMEAGRVEFLAIIGGNPVFTAPADLDFRAHLFKVPFRVHLSLYDDETSELCHWHIPEAHYLESWSDARAFDGTSSIIQPLIAPLYSGRSAHEFLSALQGESGRTGHQIVRGYWESQYEGADFDGFWRKALHDGLIEGTALAPRQISEPAHLTRGSSQSSPTSRGGFELSFRIDPSIYDGRFANNAWLQELPKPLTKLTWSNAALLSPRTAQNLNLSNGDFIRLEHDGRSIEVPVWVLPGHPDQSVTVHLGYGRSRGGRVGTGVGFNVYPIRTSAAPWIARGVRLERLPGRYSFASTQHHHSMEGRHLVRVGTVEEYRANPHFAQELGHRPGKEMSMYPGYEYSGYAWGMAINLGSCIGCNACVIACQAENNIPVVGKDEVDRGREMHWLRVDRYYEGDLDNPRTHFQPVPCMHCETAPCEPVCPVAATVHSSEGLNEMTYNRCVGTRYCSNNCPYKVRRFNFYEYSDWETPSLKLLRNPDVTVRGRGVMEKCTYCVQRINAARIEAKKRGFPIEEGEVQTACQQVCPTEAIVFGDINNGESRVRKMKDHPLNYGILEDLNTRPRTTYWARLRNPNPEMERESREK